MNGKLMLTLLLFRYLGIMDLTLREVHASLTVCPQELLRQSFVVLWSCLLTHHWELACSKVLKHFSPLWGE